MTASLLASPGCILSNLNNAVVWMVSACPLISKSSSPCINPLVTVPREPVTNGIIITFMFHSFFNSLARSRFIVILIVINVIIIIIIIIIYSSRVFHISFS